MIHSLQQLQANLGMLGENDMLNNVYNLVQ